MEWHTSCAHLEECALAYMPDPAIHICIKVWKTAPLAPMPCPPSWSSFILLIILTYCRMISLVWCLRELQWPIGNTPPHTHTWLPLPSWQLALLDGAQGASLWLLSNASWAQVSSPLFRKWGGGERAHFLELPTGQQFPLRRKGHWGKRPVGIFSGRRCVSPSPSIGFCPSYYLNSLGWG